MVAQACHSFQSSGGRGEVVVRQTGPKFKTSLSYREAILEGRKKEKQKQRKEERKTTQRESRHTFLN